MIAKSLLLSAKAKAFPKTASCKRPCQSPGSRVGSISRVNTRAVSTIPGCRAGPRLSPVPPDPKVRAVSTWPPPQDRASVLLWLGQSPGTGLQRQSCLSQLSQPWGVSTLITRTWSGIRNLTDPGQPVTTWKLAWYTWSCWEILASVLERAATHLFILRLGLQPPLGFSSRVVITEPRNESQEKTLVRWASGCERSWRHQRRVRLMVCWREKRQSWDLCRPIPP